LSLEEEVMGYEVKLLIGEVSKHLEPDYKRSETPEIDGNTLYYPYLEDKNKKWIPNGREKRRFQIMGTLDLCKIGSGPLAKLIEKSTVKAKKPKQYIYWYPDGNTEEEEDCYGDRFKPVSVKEVVKALEEEVAEAEAKGEEQYRRFVWALGLLRAMQDYAGSELSVLFYGH